MDRIKSIISRYLIILILSIFSPLLYLILSPVTIYSSYALISIFYHASLSNTVISFSGKEIELIEACISGLSYLLLLALNLSLEMPLRKRLNSLAFTLLSFFAFNVLRILLLSAVFASGASFFNTLHAFFWYFGSILAVVVIWIINVRIFKIKEVPFIADIRYLTKQF